MNEVARVTHVPPAVYMSAHRSFLWVGHEDGTHVGESTVTTP